MYCFEFYNCTKAQLEKRKIYGAIEENSYLKVVTSSNDSHATYKKAKGLRFICYDKKYDRNTSYRQTYFRYNLPNAHPIGKKRNTLWRCCYCGKKLKKRERKILNERFIIGKTQMEIANELGISQAQISRIEKNAITNIKKLIK
jgi:hypothetical protein